MSWYGIHVKKERDQPIEGYAGGHRCKLCKYRIRAMRYAGVRFGNFTCSRCGLKFPAEAIEKDIWYEKVQAQVVER